LFYKKFGNKNNILLAPNSSISANSQSSSFIVVLHPQKSWRTPFRSLYYRRSRKIRPIERHTGREL